MTVSKITSAPKQNDVLAKINEIIDSLDSGGSNPQAQAVNTLATSGTIALTDNSINRISPSGTVTFTLPTVSDTSVFHQILVQISMPSTARTINVGTSRYFNKTAPDLSSTGYYNLIYEYDSTYGYWVCGLLSKGQAS